MNKVSVKGCWEC